jgi:opacity protein-like surface antigen
MRTRQPAGLAAAALALALATPARAQYEPPRFRLGGGAIMPAGTIHERFETGWHLTGGLGWKLVRETLVLRFDYGYSRERLVGGALENAFVNGEHQIHSFEADLEWTVSPGSPAPVHLLAGPGVYLQPEDVLGSRSSTNLGFNLGVGVDIPIRGRVAAFLEIRWRFVWGDVYGLPGGSGKRGSASYFPVTLGIRF